MTNNIGYVYILKNESYHEDVFKIGFTKNLPEDRAKEIFKGGTGVPQPFKVATACKVGDYKRAEAIIHKRLRPYRVNTRREFFELPFEICQSVMLEVCNDINCSLGIEFNNPIKLSVPSEVETEIDEKNSFMVRVEDLMSQDKFNSTLSEEQKGRVNILMEILKDIYPCHMDEWINGFMRDFNPESEIRIWEAIARAYIRTRKYHLSKSHGNEIFSYLLMRSCSKKSAVMKEIKNNKLPLEIISKILDGYDLKPKPLRVSRVERDLPSS